MAGGFEQTVPWINDMESEEIAVWIMAQHLAHAFGNVQVRQTGRFPMLVEQRNAYVRWAEGVNFTSIEDYPHETVYIMLARDYKRTRPQNIYILNHSMTYFLSTNRGFEDYWIRKKHKNEFNVDYQSYWSPKQYCRVYPINYLPEWKRDKNEQKSTSSKGA